MSILLGEHPEHLRIEGSVTHQGHEPPAPRAVPGGLGVEPIGLSHVLSARGLDQLDADMQHARHELAADPTDATIERFTALEEKFGNWAATKPSPKCHGSRPDWVSRRTSSWRTSIRSRAVSVGAST